MGRKLFEDHKNHPQRSNHHMEVLGTKESNEGSLGVLLRCGGIDGYWEWQVHAINSAQSAGRSHSHSSRPISQLTHHGL